jgi:nickel-dependent lactate racemase
MDRIGKTIVRAPQLVWNGPRDLELPFPEGWDVEVCNFSGHDRPAMNGDQIRAAVAAPVGMPPLREFARGRKEAVVIFDDITRPLRAAKIVPYVLEELAEAGIPDQRIRFIAAVGTHGPMDRTAFAKKLGEAALARFPVYNHNAHDNCTYVGTTSRGTKLLVNAEVMCCDLKIAIGGVTPHTFTVFSGGGKMILPGVSSIESIATNHVLPMGDYETNSRRLDMEEVAMLAGLDMVIECLFNRWGETTAIFAGAEIQAHESAVMEARAHYLCRKAENKDVVVANMYAKAMEARIGIRTSVSLAQKGGSLVLIANAPEGQASHYLFGPWGRVNPGGRIKTVPTLPPNVDRLIIYSEYPDIAGFGNLEPAEKVLHLSSWSDVIKTLQGVHGNNASVAVYPNSDTQYFG